MADEIKKLSAFLRVSIGNITTDKESKELDTYLSDRVYLVGFYCTIADVVLFLGLYSIISEMSFYDKQKHLHLSRWFDQVQHQPGILQNSKKVYFQRNMIYSTSSCH
ncbi:hypothetical protein LSH36_145g07010 [Paralvinella palmiformis]|uniref:GST C-terminal domain-containing protein n=1 Tax=Paralvinella palmiformis TaxID=53620 RepID=A0AAD9N7M4_9ANNE|nr:hypothetical protein LSH36_145g07010 [Paralvinella palmiformis]